MNKLAFIAALGAGALALPACNSTNANATAAMAALATSGGSGGQNKPQLEALQATQDFNTTDIAALPTGGTANYTGFAQIVGDGTVLNATEIVGEADLTVGFAGTGSMTGTLSNFDDPTGTYTGTLDVTGGTFSDANGARTVRSDVSGTLTRNTGTEFSVDGNLSGRFTGTTGQHLVGFDDITVTSGGQSAQGNISLNASQ